MSLDDGLLQWTEEVSTHLPHLSKPQAQVLALYSFGLVMVRTCGQSQVAAFLAGLSEQKENTVRQRLREFCYEASAKRGAPRQAVDVTDCFADLLSWVLAWWASEDKRLALALDASTLGQRFTVLCVSVVYRGCALPVAWTVLAATTPDPWRPYWEELLRQVASAVPCDWQVIVLADRGLYAPWLYTAIQAGGWHPFLRINRQGSFRPQAQGRFRPLSGLLPTPGHTWAGAVECFKSRSARLRGTLLAGWEAPHTEPWLILTDLPPDSSTALWYSLRTWIEQGFKDMKRGGWHWEQTKMTDPQRAARLWLVLAVATLWSVSVGGMLEAEPSGALPPLPLPQPKRPPARRLSCFTRGLLHLVALALKRHALITHGAFFPEPWPAHWFSLTELQSHLSAPLTASQKTYP